MVHFLDGPFDSIGERDLTRRVALGPMQVAASRDVEPHREEQRLERRRASEREQFRD
jgi:hypothetical protein